MVRYFIFLSYNGFRYHGWQRQPGNLTVQEVLEHALSLKLGIETPVTGAGRTDTGVHAMHFVAHFESINDHLHRNESFIHSLNRFLPVDISIESIVKVKEDAHARFSALSRSYIYRIIREKCPFAWEGSWYIYGNLDIDAMKEAASVIQEYSDFASFCRSNSDVKTTICNISRAVWQENGNTLEFTITADRFLRNMVRAIVGTMAEIGKGRISVNEFRVIVEACDRRKAGESAPAKGLYLSDIVYPQDIFNVTY